MDYKKTVRSPNYGKIFAYDKQGREINTLDVLKLEVVQGTKAYTVGQLLEEATKIASLQETIEQQELLIINAERAISNLENKVQTLSQLAVLLDAKIQSSQIK